MRTKWRRFLDGFDSIYVAIMFRLDYNDNIDRCAFFCEISCGWYEMQEDYIWSQETQINNNT
jgi:hypothetical protein